MEIRFAPEASSAIQDVYEDPEQEQLADRLEAHLDLLDSDPADQRVRRHRMQDPPYWLVKIYGSKRDFAFIWELRNDQIWILWAGDWA